MGRLLIFIAVFGIAGYFLYRWRKPATALQPAQAGEVRPEDLRVRGELLSLYAGVAAILALMLILLRMTLGAILLLVGMGIWWLKVRQGQLLGQAVKVSEQQLPEIHAAALQAARRLSMPMPQVFVIQHPVLNAYAMGFWGRKSVVLHSATVEALSPLELQAVLGHEFTHIKCLHTHWLVFTTLKDTLRIPILSDVLGLLLLTWSRKAEYTCDRGGLVACRDLRASISALAKIAVGKTLFEKLDLEAFAAQQSELNEDEVARLGERFSTHPYIINRIAALREFSRSPVYERIRATDAGFSWQP